ncbi:hypothetical protein B0H19DRAFT_577445 [Mycena capillaripes]|nr:hypothetical protein B0H19DRAFT_577445 [Mycena capillaripes]
MPTPWRCEPAMVERAIEEVEIRVLFCRLNDTVDATNSQSSLARFDGVLTNGDLCLPRGLTTLYARNLIPNSQDDISHYIAVLFNAIMDLATANGTNISGNSWTGPPNSTFNLFHQINALEALVSAISLRNDSDPSTLPAPFPTPTESGIAPSPPQHSSNKSLIIGSVLGAVALIGVVTGIWALVRRRRRSKSTSMGMSRVSPFGTISNVEANGQGMLSVKHPLLWPVLEAPRTHPYHGEYNLWLLSRILPRFSLP